MANNNYMRTSERTLTRRSARVREVDGYTALAAQLSTVQKQLGVCCRFSPVYEIMQVIKCKITDIEPKEITIINY